MRNGPYKEQEEVKGAFEGTLGVPMPRSKAVAVKHGIGKNRDETATWRKATPTGVSGGSRIVL